MRANLSMLLGRIHCCSFLESFRNGSPKLVTRSIASAFSLWLIYVRSRQILECTELPGLGQCWERLTTHSCDVHWQLTPRDAFCFLDLPSPAWTEKTSASEVAISMIDQILKFSNAKPIWFWFWVWSTIWSKTRMDTGFESGYLVKYWPSGN